MAKSRTSFQKRQKEIARMEKARDKMAKRKLRKLAAKQPHDPDSDLAQELANPAEPPSTGIE